MLKEKIKERKNAVNRLQKTAVKIVYMYVQNLGTSRILLCFSLMCYIVGMGKDMEGEGGGGMAMTSLLIHFRTRIIDG